MPELIVMDRTGDTRTSFVVDDKKAVKAAMTRFKELMGKGYIAAQAGVNWERGQLIRKFNPRAETDIIMYPPFIGG